MTSYWDFVECLQGRIGVQAMWRREIGQDFDAFKLAFLSNTGRPADSFPSPHVCGCRLAVVKHADESIVGVSRCGSAGCRDLTLKPADIELWELNVSKLGRAIAWAFDSTPRELRHLVPYTVQVAAFGSAATTVFLTLPKNRDQFQQVITHLGAEARDPFILIGLTNQFVDHRTKELLARSNSEFFDLVSHTTFTADGQLKTQTPARELFARFLPKKSGIGGGRELPAARYHFHQAGSMCGVVFDGSPEFHIENTLGAKYLDYLLHHPNEPISAFDLEVKVVPEKGQARDKDSIQVGVDGKAVVRYLRELESLRGKRDQAADDGDPAELDRIDGEIEVIEQELKNRGRSVDTGERARGNVSKAIIAVGTKVMKRGKHEKAFAAHIKENISLGYKCIYNRPEGADWK